MGTTASLTLDLAAKMLASRVGVAATRSAAKPFMAQNLPKLALAARVPATQYRPIATVKQTPAEGNEILAKQRLNRPVSPHLGIYKMNQTWLGSSAWTRITGCALSGVAYLYFGSYLVAPLFGWHLESASLAAAFAGMPFIVNGGIKFLLGFPFAMHFSTASSTSSSTPVGASPRRPSSGSRRRRGPLVSSVVCSLHSVCKALYG